MTIHSNGGSQKTSPVRNFDTPDESGISTVRQPEIQI
jgi:hypothetical protein